MGNDKVQSGFELWSDEIATLGKEGLCVDVECFIVALAGIYSVGIADKHQLTSYNWRQSVLKSPATIHALSTVMPERMHDELIDDSEILVSNIVPSKPEDYMSSHERVISASILDGIPPEIKTIQINEYFLARTLGIASYDFAVNFYPLRLTDTGFNIVDKLFPQTASLLRMSAL